MTTAPPSAPPPRQDASLALLESLIADALDPGYLQAARRRSTSAPRRARTARVGTAVSILAVSLVLTLAVEQVRASAPSVAERRQALVQRINTTGNDVSSLERQVTTTNADVDRLRKDALGGSTSVAGGAAAQLDALSQEAGLTPLVGPGVTVTVDDASDADTGDQADSGDDLSRVLDVDLQDLTNGLWQAGAEAVSVNGHRLTALSAIRGAGDAVLVDYRPLARPYVVTAIGAPTLARRFRSGPAGHDFTALHSDYGIRYDVEVHTQVSVPAATAVTLRSVRGAG